VTVRKFILTVALLVMGGNARAASRSVEELKTMYIERFTRFIEWPSGALPAAAPFVVCIQGSGGAAGDLGSMAASRQFKERSCEVRRVRAGSSLGGCHLLYIAPSEAPRLVQILEAVSGKPVLTVGDSQGFAERGVLINLFEESGYLRFDINMAAVQASPLKFSSRLLRLGRQVQPQQQQPPPPPP
jgi:hypothetical protein